MRRLKSPWKVWSIIHKSNIIVLYEISLLLNCGLDRQTLSILVSLCENGVNPEALANVVKELKQEAAALKV